MISQVQTESGYYLTLTKDTVKGEIVVYKDFSAIAFKSDTTRLRAIQVNECAGFGLSKTNQNYRTVFVTSLRKRISRDKKSYKKLTETVFAERIITGTVNVYVCRDPWNEINGCDYYLERPSANDSIIRLEKNPLIVAKKILMNDSAIQAEKKKIDICEIPQIVINYNSKFNNNQIVQSNFNPPTARNGFCYGYIVTPKNDTIYGQIKDRSDAAHDESAEGGFMGDKFKTITFIDFSEKPTTLKITDCISYHKSGIYEEDYRVIPVDVDLFKTKRFAKVVVDGPLTLYYHIHTHNVSGGQGKTAYRRNEVHCEGYFVQKEGEQNLISVSEGSFKSSILKLISDDQELKNDITFDKLGYKDMKIIISKYNEVKAKSKKK